MKLELLFTVVFWNLCFCKHKLEYYKTECIFNPKHIANGTCKIVNTVSANVDWDLLLPTKNSNANFTFYKLFHGGFRPFMYKLSFSMCDLADKSLQNKIEVNSIIRGIMKTFGKHTNGFVCNPKVSKLTIWINET